MNHIIISFDLELGWGFIETGEWRMWEQAGVYQSLHPIFRRLIAEMDALEIPATWATVGAMVASPCQKDFSFLPVSAQKNIELFLDDADPMTKDGRDLLEIVLDAKAPHEVASHSFSHTRFNYEGYDPAAQAEDLKRSISVLEKWTGQTPKAFVFPQNIAPGFESVEAAGFEVARINPGNALLSERNLFQKISDDVLRLSPAVGEIRTGSGLILHTSSLFFNWGGRMPHLRRYITLVQAVRAMKRTAKGLGDTHFWLHPSNLAITPHLLESLTSLLRKAAKLRDQGRIEIRCMSCR